MLINAVELRNIKSYAAPGSKIGFRPGVNLIWGQNGSGKTTILEAIGYALFGALDYNIGQFIREGTQDGEIVLTIEARDERLYQVVRTLKGAGKLEIFDPATKRKITTKKKDSEDWLTDNLGIEYGGYGKRLFENSLGVPQGKMTGSFLENEVARKAIFAPILRVDEYDLAWKKLAETASELNSRLSAIRETVARLEGSLQALPDKKNEKNALDQRISDNEADSLAQTNAQQKQADELKTFETLKIRLEGARQKFEAAQHQLELLSGQVKSAETAFLESEQAAKMLEAANTGYGLYRQALTDREELLGQQRVYQNEQRKLSEIEKKLAETDTALAACVERLKEISAAEVIIAELEPQVQHQAQLEQEISVLEHQVAEFENANDQAGAAQKLLAELKEQLVKVNQELEQRVSLENEIAAIQMILNTSNTEINQLAVQAAKDQQLLETLADQRTSAASDAKNLEILFANLQTLQAEIEGKKLQLEQTKLKVQERKDLASTLDELQKEIEDVRVQQTIAHSDEKIYQQKISELENRLELLGSVETAECPICKTPLDQHKTEQIEKEFGLEKEVCENKIHEARQLVNLLDQKIKELAKQESKLRKQQDSLPTEQRFEELITELTKNETDLSTLSEKVAAFAGTAERAAMLEKQYRSSQTQLEAKRNELEAKRMIAQELQEKVGATNRELSSLAQASQAVDLEARIQAANNDLDRWAKQSEALSDSAKKLSATRLTLAGLHDPRSTQDKQKGIAGQRLQVETEKGKHEELRGELAIEHHNQTAQLDQYAGLEASIENVKAQIQQNEQAYQDYVANENVALMRDGRLRLLNNLKAQYTEQEKISIDAEIFYGQAQKDYDPDLHAALERKNRQTGEKIAALNAQIAEMRSRSERLENELQQLHQQQKTLEETLVKKKRQEDLFEVFRFIRDGIRLAGPKVVQQRVKAISYSADRIFQDVIDDPSLTLSWDETYAIKVRHRLEERIFNQLSGGEQMAAAIAVRLAVMFQMSELRILFLDEPTANMDDTRRENLANRITGLEGLRQIFVITHDDAFRRETHHVIQVQKENDISLVSVR